MSDQKLTEEEIDMIVDKVCSKLEAKLYLNVGQGIFGLIWKGVVVLLIAIAGYGAGIHIFK